MRCRPRIDFLLILLCVSFCERSGAQTTNTPSSDKLGHEVQTTLEALRDSFVNQVKAEGFQPSLPPPTIVLDDPPSLGNYENEKNLLHIAAWQSLAPDQQARFVRMADRVGRGQSGQEAFEESVHHWVFVHELGHWWQACQHKITENHYSVEYGANRIAAAYWRLKDQELMERTSKRMAMGIAAMPNPVPEGESPERYFNENYEKLGPTPAYIRFQYEMILKLVEEKPLPSLKNTLAQPVFP